MNFIKLNKYRIISFVIIIITIYLGYFYIAKPEIDSKIEKDKVSEIVLKSEEQKTISLGLDLVGGSQLVYDADISNLQKSEVDGSMNSLKIILEKRLNPFGTSEVSVVIEKPSIFADDTENTRRVIIQIPGVANPEDAKKMIGKIPILEFKILNEDGFFGETELTGRYLEDASLAFNSVSSEPIVSLNFTEDGIKIFGDLTKENIGNTMAIFLDGQIISSPRINAAIYSNAIIEGGFTIDEAKELANNLKFGALPVPISILSSNTISASLGGEALELGLKAALFGLIIVSLFLILFYRFSGFLASIALISYTILTISIFKLLGFVFTSAGIAGFIISIGMAVDANILIFERIKEELRFGRNIKESVRNGFKRAWLSIRDGNLSSIITAVILFYMTTALVKGFALTFGLGVIVSMFSAIMITRVFLLSFVGNNNKEYIKKYFFGNFNKNKK